MNDIQAGCVVYAIVIAATAAFFYGLTAFVQLNADFHLWEESARQEWAIFTGVTTMLWTVAFVSRD